VARTDIFIQKPVLAIVVSVFILLFGLRAEQSLPVRQYPKTVVARIEVDTTYYGADAAVVAGFITTPIENAMAQVNGIDYLTSTSSTGSSSVVAHLRLNEDPDRALTEVQTHISAVHDQLPVQSQTPSIHLQTTAQGGTFLLAFDSKVMSNAQITDYLTRVVQPQLQAVPGVQTAQIWGAQNFALRAWIDPDKLTAHGLTANDVTVALQNNNFTSGAGTTAGQMVQVPLGITTGVHSAQAFRDLVIKQTNGAIIRLGDVAKVELGADTYQISLVSNGKHCVLINVDPVADANVLAVVSSLRARYSELAKSLPQGLNGEVIYDVTGDVRDSIREVSKTLLESLAIVALVVFAFLRSARASLIPVVTIPLSLVGTFAVLWMLGYSINLLTLLALVLATGLVVDDAIIVVENITREMAEGVAPLEAALRSARTLAGPIVAMTVVLVAVYVPIALRSGLTGALFTEFAMTLIGAVTVSAVLALTLSPMMSRYILRRPKSPQKTDHGLMQRIYRPALRAALVLRFPIVLFGFAVLVGSYFLYAGSTSELAPQEDQSFLQIGGAAPPTSTIDMLGLYEHQTAQAEMTLPEADSSFAVEQPGQVNGGVVLKPSSERTRSATQVATELQSRLSQVAGESLAVFQPSPLPGDFGDMPVGYVLKTTRSFSELYQVSQNFLSAARATGLFAYIDVDLKIDLPQSTVVIDRDKVASMGLDMTSLGNTLNTLLSGTYVGYFDLDGRSYKVMPEIERGSRLNAEQLNSYIVANINGVPVPLSSVAHLETTTVPEQINHFQQMNAASISGIPLPGVTQGEALAALNKIAARLLPPDYATDASGPMRQFIQESSGFAATLAMALVVIYLSLAALFGSFRDPLIILVSVPMSLGGALLFIYFGVHGATLNIYTEVGLVTLMGLISKHGILMVEVANELQEKGQTKREAIEHAALLRLRPILMTTGAMVLGVAPLVFASGSGAARRFAMGLVIASGLSIGTLFTLFVVPAFYVVLARRHAAETHEGAPHATHLAVASE
jgi:multidrug efflux pump